MTAAGVTAHVDDRFQYVFISNSAAYNSNDMSGDDWLFPDDTRGVEYYKYDDVTDTVDNATTSFALPKTSQHKGIVVPYACTLLGFYGAMSSAGNYQGALALWTFTPGYTATDDVTCTRRFYAAGSGSAWNNRAAVATDLSSTAVVLSAGDIILPSLVCPTDGQTTTLKTSFTIVLKIKLPDL